MVQTEIQKNFSHMNDMQKQAVFCTEGPLLILAGAGSGKTTVLVNRIAYILQCELCKPWQILAITFTNKAAGELKERICAAVPEGGADIWAATFHSTCARILRRYGDRIGYTSHFTVYGTDDRSILLPSSSLIGLTLSGECGQAASGSSSERLISITSS